MSFEIKNGVLKRYIAEKGVDEVIIPEGVTRIYQRAFQYHKMKSVIIPDSVKVIEFEAFCRCKKLERIVIPDSVKNIEAYAFDGTPWLENYPDDFVIVNSILIKYKGNDTRVTIPDGVKIIGNGAFFKSEQLESVIIPGGVTQIGNTVFAYCKNLRSVTIPDSVSSVGDWVFSNCSALENMVIPDSVKNMHPMSFYGCRSVIFHGVKIEEALEELSFYDIAELIADKNYSIRMNLKFKYGIVWCMFLCGMDGSEEYVKKNFAKMFRFLIDTDSTGYIQKVLDYGKFVTGRNIDKFIDYSDEQNKPSIKIMLENYKQNFLTR